MMRAITYTHFGEPDVLTIINTPMPAPKPTQLLVRVKAAALNRADILQRRGKYPPPPGESDILGLEIAGEVIQLGSAVTGFNIGDRVCGLVGSGGYAEYCVIDSQTALIIPDHLSFEEGAALPEAFLTATEALFTLGQLQPHESVLIHAGGSGVGSAAIQLAKHIGATVFTTTGHPDKAAKINALGADHIIDYNQTDFAAAIQPHGVDVIIDFVGARYFTQHLALLNPGGRLICVGMLGGAKADLHLATIITKRLQIKGLIMRSRTIDDKREMTQQFIKHWLPLFMTNGLCPVLDSVFPLTEAQAAHARMEANANVGKIVLRVQ